MSTSAAAIDYDHGRNLHTLEGPRHVLSAVLARLSVQSLLDVGCGRGTWLSAALDCGIREIAGVDGVPIPTANLHFPAADFTVRDLGQPLDLGRRFDLVICVEVAEHLEAAKAHQLVANLTQHSDKVLFSAACPGQPGQHHVNCQWPDYWQSAFNKLGYVCNDWPRWVIWSDTRVEAWYRQNLFIAERNPVEAGKESRIRPVVHPDMLRALQSPAIRQDRSATLSRIENGEMPLRWILVTSAGALWRKAMRKLRRRSRV
jgi:SAM-dependent methyltransferase